MLRRSLLLFLVACLGMLLAPAGTASAHNSLVSSDPPDGAILDAPPSQITWVFANAVPLDTLTITFTDQSGARTTLVGSTHGPNGANEVVTPLPPAEGSVSVRWRIVGPDGHPVTGRVGFTVSATAPTATVAPETTVAATSPSVTGPPVASSTPDVSASSPAVDAAGDGLWSTPSAFRWLLRAGSYGALLVAAGVALTKRLVYGSVRLELRRSLRLSLVAIAVLALAQLLVLGSDISGQAPWSAFSAIDRSVQTHVGAALLVRIALVFGAYQVILRAPPATKRLHDDALVLLALGLLGTWAFAGHSRSMRWPWLGVPVDVLHHGAAAAWLGGLVVIAFVALRRLREDALSDVMRRFSSMATVAVSVLVATGVFQAIRLVGGFGELFSADHGKLLAVKVAVLAVMLVFAQMNRSRLRVGTASAGAAVRIDPETLRRTMLIEFVIGLVIVGLTAALVVSPPAAAAP